MAEQLVGRCCGRDYRIFLFNTRLRCIRHDPAIKCFRPPPSRVFVMRVLAQQRPVTADTSLPGPGGVCRVPRLWRRIAGSRVSGANRAASGGIADRHDVSVAGSWRSLDAFHTQTGKYPALYTLEYHDTDWVTGSLERMAGRPT